MCTLSQALDILQSAGKLGDDKVQEVKEFLAANQFSPADDSSTITGQILGDGQSPEKKTKRVSA